ncbi:unnamed protein product [Heligmosomoides polygyrus]|uniref:CRAL-TRIO domain-containing protein n=1 Tax=Heligmosomoides polygyrus TaxID=6339 RepID=A0A183GLH2_HELPZ|nr:unnamed protein product [Heligmosomoides polygyrus]
MLARRYDKTGKRRRSVKFVIAESKLEAEYIRRFLGQLSPLEESRLCELKYGLQAHHKEGRPVFLLRLGNLDMKGMLRSCGLENIVKLTLSVCEEGLIRTAEATKQIGTPIRLVLSRISTWSLLVDLEGLSMRHLWRPGVQSLLRIIEIVEVQLFALFITCFSFYSVFLL